MSVVIVLGLRKLPCSGNPISSMCSGKFVIVELMWLQCSEFHMFVQIC